MFVLNYLMFFYFTQKQVDDAFNLGSMVYADEHCALLWLYAINN